MFYASAAIMQFAFTRRSFCVSLREHAVSIRIGASISVSVPYKNLSVYPNVRVHIIITTCTPKEPVSINSKNATGSHFPSPIRSLSANARKSAGQNSTFGVAEKNESRFLSRAAFSYSPSLSLSRDSQVL